MAIENSSPLAAGIGIGIGIGTGTGTGTGEEVGAITVLGGRSVRSHIEL